MKTLDTALLNLITSKICNFEKLDNIEFLKEDSSEDYQCFKMSYFTSPSGVHVCRVEVNFKKEKFSIGVEGDSFLGTFKFSGANIDEKSVEACTCETEEFSLFC
ncbi:hypothetical protein [Mangrovimonas sp. TPBH4]|uniref:hypothetical protein n=1 Tax=Mangrovimonas sp. TPBH4 TaxID=1645914 RepID=UPI0006B6234F|nr:hypothetical protein [Mangrovimonas sp. TPBH4]